MMHGYDCAGYIHVLTHQRLRFSPFEDLLCATWVSQLSRPFPRHCEESQASQSDLVAFG